MTTKKRVLIISTEMSPYLELTEFAEIANRLAVKSFEAGMEVRCIMPRFGIINERRHRLHEVVRLSGINITIDNDDYPLQIKVASLPNARLQIYFLENEELFKRKSLYHDEEERWFEDNDLRTVFFCKSALEIVKKFGWPPDIVHCSGWMSALIPMYLKSAYKREPVFIHSKSVFSLEPLSFTEQLGKDFIRLAHIHPAIKEKDLEAFKDGTNLALMRGGALHADAVGFAVSDIDKSLVAEFSKMKDKKVINYKGVEDLTDYLEIYNELAPH